MPNLISNESEFSCNFCTSKLKLSVLKSSTAGDSKKLANEANCFLPPPGGNCTFPPGAPPVPCTGVPLGNVISTGQSTVKIDGQTALGDGCLFLCPKGQPVSLSSAGQTVAKHDEANSNAGASIVGGLLVIGGVALAIVLLPEEIVAAAALGAGAAAKAIGRVAVKTLKNVATKTKNAVKAKPKPNSSTNYGANNNAVAAKYKQDLRRQMSKPHVKDPKLQKIMDYAYRPNAKIGSGSTADGIRHEIATGEKISGRLHSKKGNDLLDSLGDWIKKNKDIPDVAPSDVTAAKNVFLDIVDSLKK